MSLRWVPKFIYGPASGLINLELTLPVALWAHGSLSRGLIRRTATGVPGVAISQRKQILRVPLRFTESEWPAVRSLLIWGQTKAPFIWYPDSDVYAQDQLELAVVRLEAPRVNEPLEPDPDSGYPRVLGLSITLRQIEEGSQS